MTETWLLATIWLGLALIATLVSIWFRIATALSEIVVGTVAQLVIGAMLGAMFLGTDQSWIVFLSGTGAILLTFLAGAELDPEVFKQKWKEASGIGFVSFLAPFLGCTAAAYYLLGWDTRASWLVGVALLLVFVAVAPFVRTITRTVPLSLQDWALAMTLWLWSGLSGSNLSSGCSGCAKNNGIEGNGPCENLGPFV